MNLETAAAVQQIIQDKSLVESILSSLRPEIRRQVQDEFRTNFKLRELFPEFIQPVTGKSEKGEWSN